MGTRLSKNNGSTLYTTEPRKDLMASLVKKTRATGHMLSFAEASQDPEMVDPNNYAFYFGSFSEAASLAWKEVANPRPRRKSTSDSGMIQIPNSNKRSQAVSKKPKQNKRKPPKSIEPSEEELKMVLSQDPELVAELGLDQDYYLDADSPEANQTASKTFGRHPAYTFEQVKGMVIAFYRRNGRFPTQVDAATEPNLPSWYSLCKYLGPKSDWKKLIPPSLMDILDDDATLEEDGTVSGRKSSKTKRTRVTAGDATITTNQYWDGDTLLVELEVLKPGDEKPLKITLAV